MLSVFFCEVIDYIPPLPHHIKKIPRCMRFFTVTQPLFVLIEPPFTTTTPPDEHPPTTFYDSSKLAYLGWKLFLCLSVFGRSGRRHSRPLRFWPRKIVSSDVRRCRVGWPKQVVFSAIWHCWLTIWKTTEWWRNWSLIQRKHYLHMRLEIL